MTVDENTTNEAPLVIITGPTASGKSSVAMRIARDFGGEIICADSRTIYKYMDIGTAKPSAEDQRLVPHWGLDLVEPGESFSAADFKVYAQKKIAEIRARGAVPMLVGGTGLYIDGVLFDYNFIESDPVRRQELEALSLAELHDYCYKNNIILPENKENKRYVIRAIERSDAPEEKQQQPLDNAIVVGITTDTEVLRQRIVDRTADLMKSGMVEEAISLGARYGWGSEAMTGNVYPLVRRFMAGEITESELTEKFITADWRLAKRQRTFMRRNQCIQWQDLGHAYEYIADKLRTSGREEVVAGTPSVLL